MIIAHNKILCVLSSLLSATHSIICITVTTASTGVMAQATRNESLNVLVQDSILEDNGNVKKDLELERSLTRYTESYEKLCIDEWSRFETKIEQEFYRSRMRAKNQTGSQVPSTNAFTNSTGSVRIPNTTSKEIRRIKQHGKCLQKQTKTTLDVRITKVTIRFYNDLVPYAQTILSEIVI